GTVRHAVLEDINWLAEGKESFHRQPQSLRIGLAVGDFNAGISLRLVRRAGELKEPGMGGGEMYSRAPPAVIVESAGIGGALYLGQISVAKLVERKWRLAGAQALGKIVIEAAIDKAAQPSIHG